MAKRFDTVWVLLAFAALTSACAARGPAASRPGGLLGDPDLYRLLEPLPLEGAALESLAAYERSYPLSFPERVATVAEDPAASAAARHNAIMLLADRGAVMQLGALREALSARDLRVRGAVIVAAQRMLQAEHTEARGLIVAALSDPAPEIQAKALEVLGAGDPELLREFLARGPAPAVAEIARELLAAAEERGYPLAEDSAGRLRRTAAAGHRLEFVPQGRWPQWDAAVGTVSIAPRQGDAFTIDSVEVVRRVVPVAFSPDGRYAAYERGREIFVRDLVEGSVRNLGTGIAPRLRPFSDSFVFLRERGTRNELGQRTRLSYDVFHAPFAGAAPNLLGTLGVFVQADRHGSYSPARWMHVSEQDLKFRLEGDGLETFPLPDPFSGRGGS